MTEWLLLWALASASFTAGWFARSYWSPDVVEPAPASAPTAASERRVEPAIPQSPHVRCVFLSEQNEVMATKRLRRETTDSLVLWKGDWYRWELGTDDDSERVYRRDRSVAQ